MPDQDDSASTDRAWWPGDESGWQDYHRQMFTITGETSGFVRWKINSTGVNIARQLVGARNRGRDAWVRKHGADPEGWPLPHPPTVVWMPSVGHGACFRCSWLGEGGEPDAAAADARRHAASFLADESPALRRLLEPLAVWQQKLESDDDGPRTAG